MPLKSETISLIKGRMRIYLWLSKFYLEKPSLKSLKRLLNPDILNAILPIYKKEGRESVNLLRELSIRLDKKVAEGLLNEYNRLFVVPIRGIYVPPYESCFRERKGDRPNDFGDLLGATTFDVANFYKIAGYDYKKDSLIAPDHIGLELAFLGRLCKDELEAVEQNEYEKAYMIRALESVFLREHLLRWLPEYVSALMKSNSNFYRYIAIITEIFALKDLKNLTNSMK